METFDRRFIGDRHTSLLLIALTLASRWRFTFFERWHETLMKFDIERPDKEFQDACRQLEYNMDWMEHEGVELGADDMDAMVEAFGLDNKARVQRFYSDWNTAKKKLNSQLPQILPDLFADQAIDARLLGRRSGVRPATSSRSLVRIASLNFSRSLIVTTNEPGPPITQSS